MLKLMLPVWGPHFEDLETLTHVAWEVWDAPISLTESLTKKSLVVNAERLWASPVPSSTSRRGPLESKAARPGSGGGRYGCSALRDWLGRPFA